MKNTAIFSLCIVLLSFMIIGCASKWEHPIKDENAFIIDQNQCAQKAASLFPPLYYSSPFQAGSQYPTISHNSPTIYPHTKRGFLFPPTYSWQDYNEPDRKKAFTECMNKMGWEWSFK